MNEIYQANLDMQVLGAAVGLVNHWRKTKEPRTAAEMRLWRAVDEMQDSNTMPPPWRR